MRFLEGAELGRAALRCSLCLAWARPAPGRTGRSGGLIAHRGGSPHARHETARVHHAAWGRGGDVAARGAGAAGDAGDRILTVLALRAVDQVVIILVGVPGTYF